MLTKTFFFKALLVAASVSGVHAHPQKNTNAVSEPVQSPAQGGGVAAPAVVATKDATVDGKTVAANTTVSTLAVAAPAAVVAGTSTKSTILIFARDAASAYSATSGLSGYAIPYQVVTVPQAGVTLPALNSSSTAGNYGAIVILSEVSYDYGGTVGFQSALTAAQLAALYQYQVSFGARMVRIDVFPGPAYGTSAIGGCCGAGVEQLISISNTAAFPTSGIKTGAGVSTAGLYHYPATISNATIASEFAQFGPTTGFLGTSTAGVINKIDGRQQMVFFIGFATEWSSTSNYLQHAWITWATRGLYTGFRRIIFSNQIDDMFLISDIYRPAGKTYRLTTADLDQHVTWTKDINSRLPAGSQYFLDIGHNGNGNIEAGADLGGNQCGIGPIEYDEQIDTPLEFQKPLGTGTNLWPSTPANYPYTTACTDLDAMKVWFAKPANRDVFAHVSHTFTHEGENNATYFDVNREIVWNKAWLNQVGIAAANKFSANGIIPPAITGMHNGDAMKAWLDNGIKYVVGDNTRPVLMNKQNEFWPLISTVADNGYAGVTIVPRWATNIYYNCDLPACTVQEWIDTSAGSGDWTALLALEKATNTRHLLGLHHDPYMFHQANMNYQTAGTTTINGVTKKLSLVQAWAETVTQEMMRLVTWPMVSKKHDDLALDFLDRMARDNCAPQLSYTTNPAAKTITAVTLTTNSNTCSAKIPVTVPGTVTNTQGFTTEKLGSDPLTIWAKMSGQPITFTLSTPVAY
ncbi:related to extracellular serine-rich protein [Rhynchosporium agropyri]|uniref:Related to extracellular serine-rich protein n=1 Tax=Rhynchosporium agropyri TaxID=914238 RepID=A0A1E1L3X3_9HELO|nr:related to extracellular serine-rich protein [Rhynchosporium agropyri]